MTSTVDLVRALGGGFREADLPAPLLAPSAPSKP
jgi:hypothetical protein